MKKLRAVVVGLGYWGPNLARNLQASPDYELVGLCDRDPARLERVAASYPTVKTALHLGELLKDNPDFVAVATPVGSHYELTKMALEAGAHVLCEKPLAPTVALAEEMVALAQRVGRHLFVDHTFNYTSAVRCVRRLHEAGVFGDMFYVDSVRINLGLFQPDVDVTWDLAPHDLSILGYIFQQRATYVRATGASHNPHGYKDVAYIDLEYDGGLTAHLHLSWLSPVKVRRMIFSGAKSSCIYDDIEGSEKVKIYDHGVSFEVSDVEQRREVLVNYRRGEMRAPALDLREALVTELSAISAQIRGEGRDAATGIDGVEVVRILEACQSSLARDGARVAV